jgi:chromosomal replication initiation ATPase DnaA
LTWPKSAMYKDNMTEPPSERDLVKQVESAVGKIIWGPIDGVSSHASLVLKGAEISAKVQEYDVDGGPIVVQVAFITDAVALLNNDPAIQIVLGQLERLFPQITFSHRLGMPAPKPRTIKVAKVKPEEKPAYQFLKFLNHDFTFEKFITDEGNEAAFEACKIIAEKPKEGRRTILVYSHPALGKTHIVSAIANEIREHRPDTSMYFFKRAAFYDEGRLQAKAGKVSEWMDKLIAADVLIMDDIQMIFEDSGDNTKKKNTSFYLDVFYHVLDIRTTGGDPKSTIFTSDKPLSKHRTFISQQLSPDFVPGIHFEVTSDEQGFYRVPAERITTRVESGRLIEIAPPSPKVKERFIRQRLEETEGILISPKEMDQIVFIAHRGPNNFRLLDALLSEVILSVQKYVPLRQALAGVVQRIIDGEVQGGSWTGDADSQIKNTYLSSVIKDVAQLAGINQKDLVTSSRIRDQKILFIRDTVLQILRHLGFSNSEIANAFQVDSSLVPSRLRVYDRWVAEENNKRFYDDALRMLNISTE